MRATAALRRGFMGRSVDEFKRLASIAFRAEGVKGPSAPLLLQHFPDAQSVTDCKTMSDEEIGGLSTCALDWVPPTANAPTAPGPNAVASTGPTANAPAGYARFHGTISTALPRDRPEIQRTGFAAWRTRDRPATAFGRSLWDIDMYTYLALRIRSDGRSYFVNLQTESVVPTDLHQHRLFAKHPGRWETVFVKWNDFVRTNHGFVIEPQTEMLRRKVRTVGFGLTDRVPGAFELCVARMWATNEAEVHEHEHEHDAIGDRQTSETGTGQDGQTSETSETSETGTGQDRRTSEDGQTSGQQLKDKHGKSIRWG